MSLGYFAMALNGLVLPLIYNESNKESLGTAMLLGFVLINVQLIIIVLINLIDRKADKVDGV